MLGIALAIAGMLVAIPLSIWAWGAMRRSRRSAGFVVASALLLSFPFLGGRGPDLIEEAKDETRRKKDDLSGEPPVAGSGAD